MRWLLWVLLLALTSPALAADEPAPAIALAPGVVEHVIVYLRSGGTRQEADALAQQVLVAAQADLAKQNATKSEPPQKGKE